MPASTVVAIAAGAAVLATTVAVLAWRERSAPESRALAGLMAAAGAWAGLRAVRVAVASLEGKLFVATVEWVPIGATAVLWVAFANRYTGRELTGRWIPGGFAGVVGLAVVAVLLRLTNASHGLVVTGATVTTVGEARLLSTSRGPLFAPAVVVLYGLVLAGSTRFARSLLATQRRYRAQALVVVAAALSPVVASALYALGLLSVDPAPYALSVTGVGMLWAVRREDLLSARPVPSSLAREAVVERTDDAVVVVDGADRVVDANPAARALLPVDGREAPSAAAVVPAYDDLRVGESATVTVETDAGTRFFDARVVPLREAAGGSARAISLRDVTDRRIRAQRLAVLNRVLRHNIRNDMNVVTGYAEMLDGSAADAVSRTAERVARIAEETRDVVRLLDDDSTPTPARPVAAVVDDALDRAPAVNGDDGVTDAAPEADADVDATVSTRIGAPDARCDGRVALVLSALVDNAVRHNDRARPEVEVTVRRDGDRLEIRVVDDGPGIPSGELSVLDEGTESALEHGSGLGLWLVHWGATALGGDAAFEPNEPRGTVATVTVPALGPDGAASGGCDGAAGDATGDGRPPGDGGGE